MVCLINLQKNLAVSGKSSLLERERESIGKQPYFYLAFMSGVGITCLGIGIY